MSRKTGCGLLLIAAIIVAFVVGLGYVHEQGKLSGHPEAPPASPRQAPLDQ